MVNKDTGQSPAHICLRRLDCLCLIRADSRRTCEAHQCTLGLAMDHRNVTIGNPDTSPVWAVALKHGGRPPAVPCIIDVEFVPGTQNIHAPDYTQTVSRCLSTNYQLSMIV